MLDLEACIVGGGVSEAGDMLLEPIRRHLADHCWPQIAAGVQVLRAELGNDAGILGAAAQAFERLEGRGSDVIHRLPAGPGRAAPAPARSP